MKIQCDVCGGAAAATVFCCADEAALCDGCDRRVHHANKLAGKHRRFALIDSLSLSLSSSSSSSSGKAEPLCDVCKERRGFVFCQEDRAILCRDCDDPIHSANDLTMKHSRFLLPGVRLSAAPSSTSESNSGDANGKTKQDKNLTAEGSSSSSSSISEYLIKVCPGWHVEDLLVDDAAVAPAFSKEKELPALQDAGLSSAAAAAAAAAEFPKWVPLVPQLLPPLPPPEIPAIPASSQWTGPKELSPSYGVAGRVGRERWGVDDAVTVPQISQARSTKRTRTPAWYY